MGPFDRFNDRAKRVLALAQDEAFRGLKHTYIGPEHLLLGLLREGDGVPARVPTSLGVDARQARARVEGIVGRGQSAEPPSEIVLDPRTRMVIDLANEEAKGRGDSQTESAHLALGLAREGDAVVRQVLESFGVSLDKVREEVLAALDKRSSGRSDDA